MTLSNLKDYKIGGAGGRWPVIDEVADPSAIQQVNRLSCGQACVEYFWWMCINT